MSEEADPRTPQELQEYISEQFDRTIKISSSGRILPDIDNDTQHLRASHRIDVLAGALHRALDRIAALEARAAEDNA